MPETTIQPPKALAAVSVGLALPSCETASAEWPIFANFITSNCSSFLKYVCNAAPNATDNAAEDPNPAAENNSLFILIFRGWLSYLNKSYNICEI